MGNNYFCHESAIISNESKIGDNSKIWQFCHILGNSVIGKNCVIGSNVIVKNSFIGDNVVLQDNCKIGQKRFRIYS